MKRSFGLHSEREIPHRPEQIGTGACVKYIKCDIDTQNFGEKLSQAKNFALDLVFPIECLGCGSEGKWLCKECGEKIPCDIYVGEGAFLNKVIALYSYEEEIIKQAIQLLKYQFIKDMAQPLGSLFVKGAKKMIGSGNGAIIIPVPLHKKRLLERGFNQSELLARAFLEMDFVVDIDILKRGRFTNPQVELSGEERQENIKDAFVIKDKSKIIGKKIFLLDDVYTTGATMEECAKVLKESGAGEVWGMALARG